MRGDDAVLSGTIREVPETIGAPDGGAALGTEPENRVGQNLTGRSG